MNNYNNYTPRNKKLRRSKLTNCAQAFYEGMACALIGVVLAFILYYYV